MTVSTNSDWTQTVGQICLSAATELGAVGLGDGLEASEEAEMTIRLNSMLAKWSIDANLFREASGTLTIAGGTGAATLPASVRDIRSIRHIQSSTNKRTLSLWNRDEFFQLPNRSQSGASPMIAYLSKQIGGAVLYLWPSPAADVDLELDYNRAFFFAEGPDQELDIPPEWHEAVLYGLASRSAGIFGTTTLDPAKVQRCDAQARSSYERMLDSDRPDSYYFEYDQPVEAR
jgi:hypothetical protein